MRRTGRKRPAKRTTLVNERLTFGSTALAMAVAALLLALLTMAETFAGTLHVLGLVGAAAGLFLSAIGIIVGSLGAVTSRQQGRRDRQPVLAVATASLAVVAFLGSYGVTARSANEQAATWADGAVPVEHGVVKDDEAPRLLITGADDEPGSWENPYQPGTTISGGPWEVTIGAPVPASADIAALAPQAPIPAADTDYWAVPLTVTYHGTEPLDPAGQIQVAYAELGAAVDWSGLAPSLRGDISLVGPMQPGTTFETVCHLVAPTVPNGNLVVRLGTTGQPEYFTFQ